MGSNQFPGVLRVSHKVCLQGFWTTTLRIDIEVRELPEADLREPDPED